MGTLHISLFSGIINTWRRKRCLAHSLSLTLGINIHQIKHFISIISLLSKTLQERVFRYAHFTDEETDAQAGPMSHISGAGVQTYI